MPDVRGFCLCPSRTGGGKFGAGTDCTAARHPVAPAGGPRWWFPTELDVIAELFPASAITRAVRSRHSRTTSPISEENASFGSLPPFEPVHVLRSEVAFGHQMVVGGAVQSEVLSGHLPLRRVGEPVMQFELARGGDATAGGAVTQLEFGGAEVPK